MKFISIPITILIVHCIAAVQADQRVFSQNGWHEMDNGPIDRIRTSLEEARNQSGILGMSVAVLHKGKLVFAEGFGKRNDKDPFTVETIMPIASLTKAFTAAAIGELVGEGKIDWDTTPVSYLPEFQLQDPKFASQITFQDLLSHRTGLKSIELAWFWSTESRIDLVKRLKYLNINPKMTPYITYNNVMYGVAGIAAGKVEGTSYEDLVRNKVFKPLGLTNTGFSTEKMSKRENYALPYLATTFENAQKGIFEQMPLDNMATACAPSGDIYSNVLDLVRWGRTIMQHGKQDDKQVLNKESIIEILSGQSISRKSKKSADFPPTSTYGMGWGIDSYKGNDVYSHGGRNPGFRSYISLFPGSDLVVAHLANVDSAELTTYSAFYIADQILGLPKTTDWLTKSVQGTENFYDVMEGLAKGDLPARIENKPPSHDVNEVLGTYSHPVYGDITVTLEKGKEDIEELVLRMRVYEGKLEHYHYDSYKILWGYGNIYSTTLVKFTTGEDGKVSGFQTEWLFEEMLDFDKK